jgi:hypothetical protein
MSQTVPHGGGMACFLDLFWPLGRGTQRRQRKLLRMHSGVCRYSGYPATLARRERCFLAAFDAIETSVNRYRLRLAAEKAQGGVRSFNNLGVAGARGGTNTTERQARLMQHQLYRGAGRLYRTS